jgi:hypothetical protein
MLNPEIWDGYQERKQRLNPIFQFGEGMVLGEALNPYKHDILLMLLLEVFYRELKDDEGRTKDDLLLITQEIIEKLDIEATDQQIARIVDGILFSGQSNLRQPFIGKYFDSNKKAFQEQKYRYLVNDTNFRQKKLVYKLSDQSQSIIFMSREVLDELPIEFEQLYVIQLIRKGNLNSALKSIDVLLTKIKNDIYKEEDYRFNLKRDPKNVLYNARQQTKRREDFEKGLTERKDNFEKMRRLLEKLENVNEKNKFYASELEIRINQTYKYNEIFTNKVYENHALESKIRKNPKMLLGYKKRKNFKEELYENNILTGVLSEEELDVVLSSLFSPKQPIYFPFESIFIEQELVVERDEKLEMLVEDEENQEHSPRPKFDWEKIALYWKPIFESLLEDGLVKLSDIEDLNSWTKEAVELWVMFNTNKETIFTNTFKNHKDDCLQLIQTIVNLDKKYADKLQNKLFCTSVESDKSYVQYKGLIISPFVLHIKDKEGW